MHGEKKILVLKYTSAGLTFVKPTYTSQILVLLTSAKLISIRSIYPMQSLMALICAKLICLTQDLMVLICSPAS